MGKNHVISNAGSVRNAKWDILRCSMIFLVVLGHMAFFYTDKSEVMESLYFFIYTFHMPIFVFISGLFSKNTINLNNKEKIFGYFVLYIVLEFIQFSCKILAGKAPEIELFANNDTPWFVLALFIFMIVTMFIKDFSPKYILPFCIWLACLAGYDSQINDFLALSRVIVYFPFFYSGYILDAEKIEKICESKVLKAVSGVILAAYAVFVFGFGEKVSWLLPLVTGRSPYASLGTHARYGFIFRLVYYAVVAVLCAAIIIITPSKTLFGIVPKLGQRTLAVYGLHYIPIYFMYNYFDCKDLFDSVFNGFAEWIIIPVSLLITLFFSLKPFNDFLAFFTHIPIKKKANKT